MQDSWFIFCVVGKFKMLIFEKSFKLVYFIFLFRVYLGLIMKYVIIYLLIVLFFCEKYFLKEEILIFLFVVINRF